MTARRPPALEPSPGRANEAMGDPSFAERPSPDGMSWPVRLKRAEKDLGLFRFFGASIPGICGPSYIRSWHSNWKRPS